MSLPSLVFLAYFYLNKWDLNDGYSFAYIADRSLLSEQVGFKHRVVQWLQTIDTDFYLNKWDLNLNEVNVIRGE